MGLKEWALGLLIAGIFASSTSVVYKKQTDTYHIHTGINLTSFPTKEMTEQNKHALERIAKQQYSHIVINPVLSQDSLGSDSISGKRFSYEHLEELIDYADDLKLSIIMKPLIHVKSGQSRTKIFPKDTGAWFSNYRENLLGLIHLCEKKDVENFVIATELDSLLIKYPEKFSELAKDVKREYSGQTTLSFVFNHDSDTLKVNIVDNIPVDNIGIDFYVYTRNAHDTAKGKYGPLHYMKNISKASDKPIIITEIGYRSVENAVKSPMFNYRIKGNKDDEIQASAYKNFLYSFHKADPEFKGYMVWITDTNDYSKDILGDSTSAQIPIGYTIFGKKAEDVLLEYNKQRYFKRYGR